MESLGHIFEMGIERVLAAKTIDAFLAAGYLLGVNDGEETVLKRCTSAQTIYEAMFSTDEDYLIIYKANPNGSSERCGWVRFIYGNSGWDVMSDWSSNEIVNGIIGDDTPLSKLCDKLGGGDAGAIMECITHPAFAVYLAKAKANG